MATTKSDMKVPTIICERSSAFFADQSSKKSFINEKTPSSIQFSVVKNFSMPYVKRHGESTIALRALEDFQTSFYVNCTMTLKLSFQVVSLRKKMFGKNNTAFLIITKSAGVDRG